jgi:hypothetical protein
VFFFVLIFFSSFCYANASAGVPWFAVVLEEMTQQQAEVLSLLLY